ncbi:MAG: DUF1800 domain-containing protein [Pseudomonadota bacterium]
MSLDRETLASVRFGYGLNPRRRGPRDAADLLAGLEEGARAGLLVSSLGYQQRADQVIEAGRASREMRQAAKRAGRDVSKAERKKLKEANSKVARELRREDVRNLLTQRVNGDGMFERLCSFWADNFTVGAGKPGFRRVIPAYEYHVIRPRIMGSFREMLHAVVQNPSMLIYLDQANSIGPKSLKGRRSKKGLNENLARELLELHTLGVSGPYTQEDVRQLALLLTGFTIDRETGKHRFDRDMAEPGYKHILGKSYGGPRPLPRHVFAFLDDLARHPATAEHLARKLATHFISDTPPEDLVRHIAAAYRESDGYLPAVYAAMLEHPGAWEGPLGKVKQPVDYVVAILRATGQDPMSFDDKVTDRLYDWMRKQNQPLWAPSGPDGWPEGANHWITSPSLSGRFQLAARVAQQLARRLELDPRVFARETLGSSLQPVTEFAVGAAETREDGFALVFASPEFNRR